MKTPRLLTGLLALFLFACGASAEDFLAPAEAAKRVAEGKAVLVDVREPAEWSEGVVEDALLLPLSDLRGERAKWGPALAAHPDKTLILYCRSGNRSAIAAKILEAEGRETLNAGGFAAWKKAGQPVVTPPAAAP